MQALAPGDAQEPRPIAPAPPPDVQPGAVYGRDESGFGAIAVRVQPADAEVLVDGERWDSSGIGNRLTIQVPDGAHRVEVRKAGFQGFSSVVQVRRGETATLNVSLTKE
jgi:hypothetical protein